MREILRRIRGVREPWPNRIVALPACFEQNREKKKLLAMPDSRIERGQLLSKEKFIVALKSARGTTTSPELMESREFHGGTRSTIEFRSCLVRRNMERCRTNIVNALRAERAAFLVQL